MVDINLYLADVRVINDKKLYLSTTTRYFLWPRHNAAITKTITMQRKRILLVELLNAKYAHTHSTNRMRSLCVVIVIVLVFAAV